MQPVTVRRLRSHVVASVVALISVAVPPAYVPGRPRRVRRLLMMFTAAVPPWTSAMMSCASSQRAKGIGLALSR